MLLLLSASGLVQAILDLKTDLVMSKNRRRFLALFLPFLITFLIVQHV
jgi:hypothetical protein